MSDRIRIDEPAYVARYRDRARTTGIEPDTDSIDTDVSDPAAAEPLYLRRYRAGGATAPRPSTPSGTRPAPAAPVTAAMPHRAEIANDVYLVRHGETVGPSDGAGLSEQGAWQAETYGRSLAGQFRDGDRVVVCHAPSERATDTAARICDGLVTAGRDRSIDLDVVVSGPMAEFGNVRFVGPDGITDVSDAFRADMSERAGRDTGPGGDVPLWRFEMERLWQIQLAGGDPTELWLSVPMLHFEPPSMCVRRMWAGIALLGDRHPGAHLVVATHPGCVRAFAVAALGYDPGEPYNTEHVRARIFRGRTDALISYRNRYQEICVPPLAELPVWNTTETWQPPVRTSAQEEAAAS